MKKLTPDFEISTDRGTMEEMMEAVKKGTNLRYAFGKELKPFTLRKDTRGEVGYHCIVSTLPLPAGTDGWLLVTTGNVYDHYVRIWDEDYAAPGAKVIRSISYYTFFVFVEAEGEKFVAHAFQWVKRNHETGEKTVNE